MVSVWPAFAICNIALRQKKWYVESDSTPPRRASPTNYLVRKGGLLVTRMMRVLSEGFGVCPSSPDS
jgi:hypothetical protein